MHLVNRRGQLQKREGSLTVMNTLRNLDNMLLCRMLGISSIPII